MIGGVAWGVTEGVLGGEVILQKAWMRGVTLLSQGIGGGVQEVGKGGGKVIGRELLLKGEDPETDHVTVKEIKRVVTSHPLESEKDPRLEKDPPTCLRKLEETEKVSPDLTSPDQDLLRDWKGQDPRTGKESLRCTTQLCSRR